MAPKRSANKMKKRAKRKSRSVQWAVDDSDLVTPRETDVLLGRGSGIANYPGNVMFRHIIWKCRDMYARAYRTEKRVVAELVVKTVGCLEPPGRFLRRVGEDRDYVVVPERNAVEKACQALREKKMSLPKEKECIKAVNKALAIAQRSDNTPSKKRKEAPSSDSSVSSPTRTKAKASRSVAKAGDDDSDVEDDSVVERPPKRAKKAPASKRTKTVASRAKARKKDKAPTKTTRKPHTKGHILVLIFYRAFSTGWFSKNSEAWVFNIY